ncbi:MAG: hypothetical protein U5L00_21115 [Desulfovermiculus sp.]|nr:hypothetical protein [Desulfovermiculus sp.]
MLDKRGQNGFSLLPAGTAGVKIKGSLPETQLLRVMSDRIVSFLSIDSILDKQCRVLGSAALVKFFCRQLIQVIISGQGLKLAVAFPGYGLPIFLHFRDGDTSPYKSPSRILSGRIYLLQKGRFNGLLF